MVYPQQHEGGGATLPRLPSHHHEGGGAGTMPRLSSHSMRSTHSGTPTPPPQEGTYGGVTRKVIESFKKAKSSFFFLKCFFLMILYVLQSVGPS